MLKTKHKYTSNPSALAPAQLLVLLVSLCTWGLGCVAPISSDTAALSAEGETVQLLSLNELPDGVMLRKDRLYAHPDFPNAQDPHKTMGWYPVKGNDSALRIQAKNVAAKHGGNAVYLDALRNRAHVLHVSEAMPKYPSTKALFAELETAHVNRKYTKIAQHNRELEMFKSVSISAKAKRCYAIAIVLDENASLSAAARQGVVVGVVDQGGEQSFQLPVRRAQQYTLVRDFFAGIACTAKKKSLAIELYAGKDKVPAGQGAVTVRTYEYKLDRNVRKHGCSEISDDLRPLARSEGLCLKLPQ